MIIRLAPKLPFLSWTVGNCGEGFLFHIIPLDHLPELTDTLIRFILEKRFNPEPFLV